MNTPEQIVADAIREVLAKVQSAIDLGSRSSNRIDVEGVVEILLAIADRLDPPLP